VATAINPFYQQVAKPKTGNTALWSLFKSQTGGVGGQPQGRQGNPYAGIMDEYLNQLRADLQAESIADAASRDAAMRRLIISYGDVSGFENQGGLSGQAAGFLKGALDDKTRNLAAQNTAEGLSVKARMDESNNKAQAYIPEAQAARGMLRSGSTGAKLGDQAMNYKRQGFDVLNELLGNIEGATSGFLNAERMRQRALADAAMQARLAAMQDWGGMLGYGGQPPPPGVSFIPGIQTPAAPKSSKPGSHTWFPFGTGSGGGL
jgi:hypothetical protein